MENIVFTVKVLNFNTLQPAPDAMACGGSHSIGVGSVGLHQRGADVAELLEKQVIHISHQVIELLEFEKNEFTILGRFNQLS